MNEYKYIEIHDDSYPTDERLERFVDSLSEIHRTFLFSAHQHGGHVTLVWHPRVPSAWAKKSEVLLESSEGSENLPVTHHAQPIQLCKSLSRLLTVLGKMEAGNSREVTADDRRLLTPETLRDLERLGHIDCEILEWNYPTVRLGWKITEQGRSLINSA